MGVKAFKNIWLVDLAFLILVWVMVFLNRTIFSGNVFFNSVTFMAKTIVYIGVIFHWGISMRHRVMHKNIKKYIWFIVLLAIFWTTLRNLKWIAFKSANIEGRMLWYFFYIPMILTSLFLLFIALSVSEDEKYSFNKKWKCLYVFAAILLLLIFTNDIHQFVFKFNPNFENWDKDYSYGFAYAIIVLFMVGVIFIAATTLFKKWRKFNKSKERALIILISAISLAYILTYIFNRPLASSLMGLTDFCCMICILFLESCIQMGLIRSNKNHRDFFAKADITAQILDNTGATKQRSMNSTDISKFDFLILKESEKISFQENIVTYIAPIHGGYVTWNSDITDINNTIREIEMKNRALFDEVEFLQRLNKQREETVRTQKQSAIQDIIFKEIQPINEQIKSRISQNENSSPDVKIKLLYEISVISVYMKRKINLILMAQSKGYIRIEEVARCFKESFQSLKFSGADCYIHVVQSSEIEIETAILSYDLFEFVMEKVLHCPKEVFVTYNLSESSFDFSIRVSASGVENIADVVNFEREKCAQKGLSITMEEETDGYFISLN